MIKIPDHPFMGHEEIVLLDRILSDTQPARCLEWGAGASTLYFPVKHKRYIKKWMSVEHDPDWFYAIADHGFPANVNVLLTQMPDYITCPQGKFDFILIDGLERVRCMKEVAEKKLLNPDGFVILHDSGRLRYKEGYKYFKIRRELRKGVGTAPDGGSDFAGLMLFTNSALTIMSLP